MRTPGPWVVAQELCKSYLVVDGGTRAPVALVHALDQPDAPDMQARANARLIASAPVLLKELERAADGLRSAVLALACPASPNEAGAECLDNHSCGACDDYVDRNGMTRRSLMAREVSARAAIALATKP